MRAATAGGRARKRSRNERGYTLTELSVAMGVGTLLATGFFQSFQTMSNHISQEAVVSTYQDTVRSALHQIGRDLRLAAANPTGTPDLFDGLPVTDVGVDIDPDRDGDLTNAILVRADKRGTYEKEADGDADDSLETVMIHFDKPRARLMRHVWNVHLAESGTEIAEHTANLAHYDASPFLEGICTFKLSYFDRLDNPTTDQEEVAGVVVEVTSASGPGQCFDAHSYTRSAYAVVRIRNR